RHRWPEVAGPRRDRRDDPDGVPRPGTRARAALRGRRHRGPPGRQPEELQRHARGLPGQLSPAGPGWFNGGVTAIPTALRDSAVRDSARVAVFAALIVTLTLVPGLYLLGGAVPVTLQTLGVTL